MKQKENTTIVLTEAAVAGRPFKFGLTQVVGLRASNECGEVKARTQYADGENRYLIYYQNARRMAQLKWFGESMLEMVEDDNHPGVPVFAVTELPDGAMTEDDEKDA
ncbi:hypothetical protein ABK178_003745 [Salmonella enterica subsp. enterica serovar Brandenburg]|uniref:hypothetical protein n=1 Tax=Salmonella enterica TaxID=28901 RepID=UPI001079DE72|nr:hypothetical protein [Salmonella enterica subsp. salamae]EAX1817710.1 hypothetical protein [Salmonella enterica]ECA2810703.1 hypothetical protein [Salmonella enterica subsp. enterica serovar Newport]ECF5615933.1 hypothetical protein [Salmonella enterica subsp. enterica serovar Reading]EDK9785021.1 hypothetical protein [Salmonella enterica subsp. enterica serovar Give]EEM6849055.1 hypothetical protein [Salmonella enterica subsp. enterica serovar Montevideo]HAB1304944.1 hypothetical protein 